MRLFDHYIIRVDNVWDEQQINGLTLMNGLRYIDKERDRFERKRRYGVVVGEPAGLTGKNHDLIDPGWPNPRIHVGHDLIQSKVNEGMMEYHTDWENFYNLAGTDEIRYTTLRDHPCDARVGETVYFHPSVTEPENKIKDKDYQCRMDRLICVVGDTIRMQGQYILVEPIELANESGGLLLSIDGEKELLRGIVRHGLPEQEILFQDHADWEYEINGTKYYAMRKEDVLMSV